MSIKNLADLIASVEKLEVKPGDVVVMTLGHDVPSYAIGDVHATLKATFPHQRWIVIGPNSNVQKLNMIASGDIEPALSSQAYACIVNEVVQAIGTNRFGSLQDLARCVASLLESKSKGT